MKLLIQPKSLFVPGLGTVEANGLEVRVASYQLGVGATAFWQLFRREVVPAVPERRDPDGVILEAAVPEQTVDTPLPLSGNADLTPEQFAAWGTDDDYFARAIATNLDLVP